MQGGPGGSELQAIAGLSGPLVVRMATSLSFYCECIVLTFNTTKSIINPYGSFEVVNFTRYHINFHATLIIFTPQLK